MSKRKPKIEVPLPWWWLSFAEPGRFLGGAAVQGTNEKAAHLAATKLGINPGGSVRFMLIVHVPPPAYRNKLLSRAEITQMENEMENDHAR